MLNLRTLARQQVGSPQSLALAAPYLLGNLLLAFVILLGSSYPFVKPLLANSIDQPTTKSHSLAMINYITGWSLDATGYHPTIYMLLENISLEDLSYKIVRIQGRFTDLQTGEIAVARKEIRKTAFKPHQQELLAICSPVSYELPIAANNWPKIECKIMCKIGEVDQEEVETLLIARVESVTKTDEQAFESLNQSSKYNPYLSSISRTALIVKPADHLGIGEFHKKSQACPAKAMPEKLQPGKGAAALTASYTSTIKLLSYKALPGLSNDFYNFEQCFGLPIFIDTRSPTWTWAQYFHRSSSTTLVAGCKARSGKVDLIMIKIPKRQVISQETLLFCAKALLGKFKTKPLSPITKCVRYLPTGRLELLKANTAYYRVLCLVPKLENFDDASIIIVSSLPQDPELLLAKLSKEFGLFKPLAALAGDIATKPH